MSNISFLPFWMPNLVSTLVFTLGINGLNINDIQCTAHFKSTTFSVKQRSNRWFWIAYIYIACRPLFIYKIYIYTHIYIYIAHPCSMYLLPDFKSFVNYDLRKAKQLVNGTQGASEGFEFALEFGFSLVINK